MSIKVKDDYRTNDLSLTPGGSEVTTIMKNGSSKTYDKVKFVDKYCSKLMNDLDVVEILVNDQFYWKRNP